MAQINAHIYRISHIPTAHGIPWIKNIIRTKRHITAGLCQFFYTGKTSALWICVCTTSQMNMRLYKWRKHQLSITVYHLFPWLIFQIRSYFCYFSICDLYTFQFFIIFYTCIFNNMFPSPAPFSVYFFLDTANPTK